MRGVFYLNTVEGLERIAAAEVKKLNNQLEVQTLPRGHVRIAGDVDPRALLDLKVPEDVFFVVYESREITKSRSSLGEIYRAVIRGMRFTQAISVRRATREKWPKRVSFHIVARKRGQHNFTRQDLKKTVYNAVMARTNGRWRAVEENAHVEFWIEVDKNYCLLGVRLSDRTMRHRTYKVQHMVASLRPTVAHAMVLLTDPRADDVFCDPMCGAGTILIERGEAGRYKRLIGGDKDPNAVAAAKANIGPRYKPIEIHQWDATQLPLDAGSVSAMAVNLPFGRKIGTEMEIEDLYLAFLQEAARVLQVGGRLVALTDHSELLSRALVSLPFVSKDIVPIRLLGHKSRIHVLKRM